MPSKSREIAEVVTIGPPLMIRKHACVDGPEIDSHIIDWDKFLPRFGQFKPQEQASKVKHGLA